jgi:two-component system, NarL family, invasion response regulator UvrY
MTLLLPEKIAIVDDHVLFRKSLITLINTFQSNIVITEANNGQDFIKKIEGSIVPAIILLDIKMPIMDGFETLNWLRVHYPFATVLMLTQFEDQLSAIRSLQLGATGYITKTAEPGDFKKALENIAGGKRYFSNSILLQEFNKNTANIFSKRELEFLQLACTTALDYEQIALRMSVSRHTINGYTKKIFEKLEVKSREQLMLFAIKNKIVEL